MSRPEPPSGDWHTWLLEGDRSTGKTTCAARWLLAQALAGPEKSLWAVCAPTWMMARNSLEALLAQTAPGDTESYVKATLDVTLSSKARIKGFSTESPGSIRGFNLAGAWFDDAHLARHYSFYRDGLLAALRGKYPRLLVTGIPKRVGLIRDLEELAEAGDGRVVVTNLDER